MNNKPTPVLTVSITNFKTSNNTLHSGFFLLEAALSLLLCIPISAVLVQYKVFMVQLHSTQDSLIKSLFEAQQAAFGKKMTVQKITLSPLTKGTTTQGTLTLYSTTNAPTQNALNLLGFCR